MCIRDRGGRRDLRQGPADAEQRQTDGQPSRVTGDRGAGQGEGEQEHQASGAEHEHRADPVDEQADHCLLYTSRCV